MKMIEAARHPMIRSDICLESHGTSIGSSKIKGLISKPSRMNVKKRFIFSKAKNWKEKSLGCTLRVDLLPDGGNKAGEVPHRIELSAASRRVQISAL